LKKHVKKPGSKSLRFNVRCQKNPTRVKEGADLIVTTSHIQFDLDIPVVNGLAFLTGIGKDEVLQEILSYLKG
jgi:PTS system galactitol-specific IIB component